MSVAGTSGGNFESIDALIEVHRRTNNFGDLVNAVVKKSEMVEAPDDRKQLLLYAANVRETVMEDPTNAVENETAGWWYGFNADPVAL